MALRITLGCHTRYAQFRGGFMVKLITKCAGYDLAVSLLSASVSLVALSQLSGCATSDTRLRNAETELNTGAFSEAIRHFRELCDANSITACDRLASMYQGGLGVPKNIDLATQFGRKALQMSLDACSHTKPVLCERVGMALIGLNYQELQIVDTNFIQAACKTGSNDCDADVAGVRLLLLACDSKIAAACNTAGALISAGRGQKKDLSNSRALYNKACELNDAVGCYNLARMYANGWTVKQDPAQASNLYIKACDLHEPFACLAAARIFVTGAPGVRRDSNRAVSILEKLCGDNQAAACDMLGRILISGQGVPMDWNRAVQLYKKACDLKLDQGCVDWAAVRYE